MKLTFNKTYAFISLLIFIAEVLIATSLKTGFIRHTFGDFLVVVLMYMGIKSVVNVNPIKLSFIVLVIAFTVEFLQLTPFLKTLGIQDKLWAKLIFGNTFNLTDLAAYTLGILSILIIDIKLTPLSWKP
ncbi:MAG: DUF2809 domain-containing protein [Flavobacteriaceae bacterium]